MKIFLPTRGVVERQRSYSQILPLRDLGYEVLVVCHRDEDRERLHRRVGIPREVIVPCDVPEKLGVRRIGWIRDWCVNNFTDPGEWYAMVDDNTRILRLEDPWYREERIRFKDHPDTEWRQLYRHEATTLELDEIICELISQCEELGTNYGGAASEENYFFRSRKWGRPGYVKAKFCVSRNDGVPWVFDDEIVVFSDWCRSVDQVARHGSVAINRFVHPSYKAWEPGGIGSFEERKPYLIRVCDFLKERYPGFVVQYRDEPWSIKFASTHPTRIAEWRREHGYLK